MSRKPLPFDERPTWQRVKDLQEAASLARATLHNALGVLDHGGKPAVQDVLRRQFTDAIARLEDASGYAS